MEPSCHQSSGQAGEADSLFSEHLSEPRLVSVLGATGSVGDSTLDLIIASPERYQVGALTAHNNVEKLANLARQSRARFAAIGREDLFVPLKEALAGTGIAVGAGQSGLQEAARMQADLVVGAIVGAAGIRPTMAALEAGNQLALANKEALVCAGDLVMAAARRIGKPILPVDSEHNAIFQTFEEKNREAIESIVITASGGPFRTWTAEAIENASCQDALNHPNWSMGRKITVDSASMMNKGLEVIEAHHLYNVGLDKLSVVVHPQSVIHGMVIYKDGSVLAHMGASDMRIPIAYCLSYPVRRPARTRRLSLVEVGQLSFEAPDPVRFRCFALAQEALKSGGSLPNILNAANEVAVMAFLQNTIPFGAIARVVEAVMAHFVCRGETGDAACIDDVLALDAEARKVARLLLDKEKCR